MFLAIWNNIDSFDEERSTFKNWIMGICRFKAIDYKRKYLKHIEYDSVENIDLMEEDFSEELIKDELSEEVNKMMKCLKEKDRQIFYKLYIEERKIGGLGIFLVKEMMDEVLYEYVDGQNILKLIKDL